MQQATVQAFKKMQALEAHKTPPAEIVRLVRDYAERCFKNPWDRHRRLAEIFPQDVPAGAKVLDFGCGLGQVSAFLAKRYDCQVDAIDLDKNQLEKAKIAYGDEPRIVFKLVTAETKLPAEHYDIIFSSMVIEHTHNPGTYLSKISAALKPNGHLVIGAPNVVNPRFVAQVLRFSPKAARDYSEQILRSYRKDSIHIQAWDPTHFTALLASCGFLVEHWIPTEGIPLSSLTRRILHKMTLGRRFKKPVYIRNAPSPFSRLSYTMFFRARKVKAVTIQPHD